MFGVLGFFLTWVGVDHCMGWRKRAELHLAAVLCALLTSVATGLSFQVYLLLTAGSCTFYFKKKSNICIFYIIYR